MFTYSRRRNTSLSWINIIPQFTIRFQVGHGILCIRAAITATTGYDTPLRLASLQGPAKTTISQYAVQSGRIRTRMDSLSAPYEGPNTPLFEVPIIYGMNNTPTSQATKLHCVAQ